MTICSWRTQSAQMVVNSNNQQPLSPKTSSFEGIYPVRIENKAIGGRGAIGWNDATPVGRG